jgi:hypothetical protein
MSTTTSTEKTTSRRRSAQKTRKTPFQFLDELRLNNVGFTAMQLRTVAMKAVRESTLVDEEMEHVVFDFIRLGINARIADKRARRSTPSLSVIERQEQRARTKDHMRARLDEHIEGRVQMRLLDYVTLIGKPLAECTGSDCRKMATRDRDFYAELARRLRPGERVGKHLSEVELQAIHRDCRLAPVT